MGIKESIIFVVGAAAGAASTYFILKERFEQQANQEVEEAKAYYKELYSTGAVINTENAEELPEPIEEKVVKVDPMKRKEEKEEPDYNDIIDKLNYNKYSTDVPDSEGARRPAKKPYQISMDDYNVDTTQVKKIISCFEEDGICMDNDTKEILENVAKDIGMDNIELIGMNGEDEIYVRNEQLGIDYNIVSEPGSYEDFIDE